MYFERDSIPKRQRGVAVAAGAWRAGRIGITEIASHYLGGPLTAGLPFAWRALPVRRDEGGRVPMDVDLVSLVVDQDRTLGWEALKVLVFDRQISRDLALAFGGVPALQATQDAFTPADRAVWIEAMEHGTTEHAGWTPAHARASR